MKKYTLSALLLFSLFFLEETVAGPIACKFHNSRECVAPEGFQSELAQGCGYDGGNCRDKFCKANCLDLPSDYQVRSLCKRSCFTPSTLARFNAETRERLYALFLPSKTEGKKDLRNVRRALEHEAGVQQRRQKRFWFFRNKGDQTVYEKLKAKYERQVMAKIKRMANARNKAEARRSADDVGAFVVSAAETLVPEGAAGEATPIARRRAAREILQETGAPSSVVEAVKRRQSGWRPDPLPKSEKVKRLSRELVEQARLSREISNLPPPPPEVLNSMDEERTAPPPAPPLPPANFRAAPPPPPLPNMQGASVMGTERQSLRSQPQDLLTEIKAGRALRLTPVGVSRKRSYNPLASALAKRRQGIAGDEEEQKKEEEEDDSNEAFLASLKGRRSSQPPTPQEAQTRFTSVNVTPTAKENTLRSPLPTTDEARGNLLAEIRKGKKLTETEGNFTASQPPSFAKNPMLNRERQRLSRGPA